MVNKHFVVIGFGAVLLTALTATAQQSSLRTTTGTTNNLTFSQAFALPGVTMAAGTYKFESGPNGTNANIVRVSSKNGLKTFYQGFTTPLANPSGTHNPIVFGEAARGVPSPMAAWYPIGATQAHKFQYP
jgi:hypothetical protein